MTTLKNVFLVAGKYVLRRMTSVEFDEGSLNHEGFLSAAAWLGQGFIDLQMTELILHWETADRREKIRGTFQRNSSVLSSPSLADLKERFGGGAGLLQTHWANVHLEETQLW